jgi:hypothetical protein
VFRVGFEAVWKTGLFEKPFAVIVETVVGNIVLGEDESSKIA